MKKILFSMMLAALCTSSYANHETAEKMDAEGRSMIMPLGTAAAIIFTAEKLGETLQAPPGIVKVVDLTATLIGLGFAFDSPTFKDFGFRAPLALATTKLSSSQVVQGIAHSLPFGIGTALKAMNDDGKTLVGIALYGYVTKPIYEKLRDDTKIGRFVVHGEGL